MACAWLIADSVPPSPRNLLYGQLPVLGDVRAILNDEGFVEEERQLLHGVRVRAATIAKLVSIVVDCFGICLTVVFTSRGYERW